MNAVPEASAHAAESVVAELIDLLRLERLEDNLFRGQSRDIGTKYVFGGQVLGQSLAAAQQTVPGAAQGSASVAGGRMPEATERVVHSLHAYFLRAGDVEHPIIYDVDRARDGKSFSVRRVTAIQHGQPILVVAISFHEPEPGPEHQLTMPEVPQPEDLPPPEPLDAATMAQLSPKMQRWVGRGGPFEFRHVYPRNEFKPTKRPPYQQVWFRLAHPIDGDATLHRAMLAYASDFQLIGTTTFPHGISYFQPNVQMASLDHAMWFHRPFRIDDWLLYACDSPSAQGSRGLARGMIYDRHGVLVASTAQEGLVRVLPEKA